MQTDEPGLTPDAPTRLLVEGVVSAPAFRVYAGLRYYAAQPDLTQPTRQAFRERIARTSYRGLQAAYTELAAAGLIVWIPTRAGAIYGVRRWTAEAARDPDHAGAGPGVTPDPAAEWRRRLPWPIAPAADPPDRSTAPEPVSLPDYRAARDVQQVLQPEEIDQLQVMVTEKRINFSEREIISLSRQSLLDAWAAMPLAAGNERFQQAIARLRPGAGRKPLPVDRLGGLLSPAAYNQFRQLARYSRNWVQGMLAGPVQFVCCREVVDGYGQTHIITTVSRPDGRKVRKQVRLLQLKADRTSRERAEAIDQAVGYGHEPVPYTRRQPKRGPEYGYARHAYRMYQDLYRQLYDDAVLFERHQPRDLRVLRRLVVDYGPAETLGLIVYFLKHMDPDSYPLIRYKGHTTLTLAALAPQLREDAEKWRLVQHFAAYFTGSTERDSAEEA